MNKSYADVLESYIIEPAIESVGIVPLNQSSKLIPSSINNMKDLAKLELIADGYSRKIHDSVKRDGEIFVKKIKKQLVPITEYDNSKLESSVLTEIQKILKLYISSQEFKKYCSIYTNLVKFNYTKSSPGSYKSNNEEKYYGTINATVFDTNKQWVFEEKWEKQYKDYINKINKLPEDDIKKLYKDNEGNPYCFGTIVRGLNPYSFRIFNDIERSIDDVIKRCLKIIFSKSDVKIDMSQGGLTVHYGSYRDGLSKDAKEKMMNLIISDFKSSMKNYNISESNKTYKISKDLFNEDYPQISYVYYDEDYSGDGSDYDNGLSKSDIDENKKFEKILYKVLKELETKYPKVIFDNDGYRGHGSICISIK